MRMKMLAGWAGLGASAASAVVALTFLCSTPIAAEVPQPMTTAVGADNPNPNPDDPFPPLPPILPPVIPPNPLDDGG